MNLKVGVALVNALITCAAITAGGCMVGPDYHPPGNELRPFHSAIADATPKAVAAAEIPEGWWTGFHDPMLALVVERARQQNLALGAALAQVQAARAVAERAGVALYPTSGLESQATWIHESLQSPIAQIGSHLPGFDRNQALFDVGLSASWEIDLFGGLRRARQAAGAEYQAAEATRAGTRITVTADTADTYLRIRGLQVRRRFVTQRIEVCAQQLALTAEKLRRGVATVREVAAAEAQLAQQRAAIESLDIELAIQSNRLDVLLGQQPGTVAAVLGDAGELPSVPAIPGPGTPTEFLRRRPDVVAAERTLAAAHARIGQALSEYYPRFSVGGLLGSESTSTGSPFTWATFQPEAVAGVRWRLFDFGRIGAEVARARAEQAQALAEYRTSVLRAAEDVEDAFSTLAHFQVLQTQGEASVAALERSLLAAKETRRLGAESRLTVLEAERQLLVAQEALALARENSCLASVGTYRAIGGGW